LEELRVLSVSFFCTGPIEDTRTNTKNETLVGGLVHDMRSLGGRAVRHFIQLEQQFGLGPILGLDGDLQLQSMEIIPVSAVLGGRSNDVSRYVLVGYALGKTWYTVRPWSIPLLNPMEMNCGIEGHVVVYYG
jgi:hypothetical protein